MKTFPIPSTSNQLLVDLLCTPVSMRADRHLALVRDLALGTFQKPMFSVSPDEARVPGPREAAVRAAAEAARAEGPQTEEKQVYPWEEPIYSINGGIAVLEVNGPLMKGYDDFTCWYYGIMSTDRLLTALEEIRARNDVFVLITKLKTPGGMSIGMPEAADLIVEIGRNRLTIAHTSDMACSNGMRLAVAHQTFLPTRSAIVGSIGTYLALYDYTKMLEEWGIKLELFRDGLLKGIGLMGKELTEKERDFLNDSVRANGKVFKDFVRARRGDIPDSLMQGQWFTGADAVGYNLADDTVSGFAEVMTKAQGAVAALLQQVSAQA